MQNKTHTDERAALFDGLATDPTARADSQAALTWRGAVRQLRLPWGKHPLPWAMVSDHDGGTRTTRWLPVDSDTASALRIVVTALAWMDRVPLIAAHRGELRGLLLCTLERLAAGKTPPRDGLADLLRRLCETASPIDRRGGTARPAVHATEEPTLVDTVNDLARALEDALLRWCGPGRREPVHDPSNVLCRTVTGKAPVTRAISALLRGHVRAARGASRVRRRGAGPVSVSTGLRPAPVVADGLLRRGSEPTPPKLELSAVGDSTRR